MLGLVAGPSIHRVGRGVRGHAWQAGVKRGHGRNKGDAWHALRKRGARKRTDDREEHDTGARYGDGTRGRGARGPREVRVTRQGAQDRV